MRGIELGEPLKIDRIVEECVTIECNATSQYLAVFEAQVLACLRG